MTYKPLITAALTADEVDVFEIEGLLQVIVPIAQSENEVTTVAIECKAELQWHEEGLHYNLSFCILLMPDPDDPNEIRQIWSPREASPYIPDEVRPYVLPTVQECYRAVVRKLDTTPIYRVCHGTAGVPLRNEVLTNTLEDEGYQITEDGTDELGRAFWVMQREV